MVFFFFVCGQHTFRSEVKGYEGVICQCHNCGNMSARVIKSRPFFTFCFVPIIPFTISGFVEVVCSICNFHQPLKNRPDVVSMADGGNAGPGPFPRRQIQDGVSNSPKANAQQDTAKSRLKDAAVD